MNTSTDRGNRHVMLGHTHMPSQTYTPTGLTAPWLIHGSCVALGGRESITFGAKPSSQSMSTSDSSCELLHKLRSVSGLLLQNHCTPFVGSCETRRHLWHSSHDTQMFDTGCASLALHSLHWSRRRPCWQIELPPHSTHLLRMPSIPPCL